MTKIESRPMRSNPILTVEKSGSEGSMPAGSQRFNYLFYLDFVGTLSEARCQNALRHLQVGLEEY
jgi:arogenate/prephenate dehydratase